MNLLAKLFGKRAGAPNSPAVAAPAAPAASRAAQPWPSGTPLGVRGQGLDGLPFFEKAATLTVNSKGGSLILTAPVWRGQQLHLVNYALQKEKSCLITRVQRQGPRTVVAEFAFTSPDDAFWQNKP